MSLQLLEKRQSTTRGNIHHSTISHDEAQRIVGEYITENIDRRFQAVNSKHRLNTTEWRFFVRCEEGPVGTLLFDSKIGHVIAPTDSEIRQMREKAAILKARRQGILPVNRHGFILAEYARRQAERYLNEHVAMFFNAADPVFVLGKSALWQTTIVFKMYDIGPFALAFLDINAKTGDVFPLTQEQILKIKERTHAIVEFYTQETAETL